MAVARPALVVTDLEFPPAGSPLGERFAENRRGLEAEATEADIDVYFIDSVHAECSRWRLFESHANELPTLRPQDVRLVLIEHVWPKCNVRDREGWHLHILNSLIGQWPEAIIVYVGRMGGLGAPQRLEGLLPRMRRRLVFRRPVREHSVPLQMQFDDAVRIGNSEACEALIISPPVKCDMFLFEMVRVFNSGEEVFIPDLCNRAFAVGGHVIQLAAFSGDSALEIASFRSAAVGHRALP